LDFSLKKLAVSFKTGSIINQAFDKCQGKKYFYFLVAGVGGWTNFPATIPNFSLPGGLWPTTTRNGLSGFGSLSILLVGGAPPSLPLSSPMVLI
jgi:hypothetical protein